jgi:hypothetical protein
MIGAGYLGRYFLAFLASSGFTFFGQLYAQPIESILVKRDALFFSFHSKAGVKALGKAEDKLAAVLGIVNRRRNREAVFNISFYPAFHRLADIFKGLRVSIAVAHTAVKFPNSSEVVGTALIGNALNDYVVRKFQIFFYLHFFPLLLFLSDALKYFNNVRFFKRVFVNNGDNVPAFTYVMAMRSVLPGKTVTLRFQNPASLLRANPIGLVLHFAMSFSMLAMLL